MPNKINKKGIGNSLIDFKLIGGIASNLILLIIKNATKIIKKRLK